MNQGVVMPCNRNISAIKILRIQIGETALFQQKEILQNTLVVDTD
jgi:hypothetical protein